jgi:hypothetical protein
LTCLGEAMTCRRPHRQMSAGQMANDGDAAEIEVVLTRDGADVVHGQPQIEVRPGPAAASFTQPPVFDVPRRAPTFTRKMTHREATARCGGLSSCLYPSETVGTSVAPGAAPIPVHERGARATPEPSAAAVYFDHRRCTDRATLTRGDSRPAQQRNRPLCDLRVYRIQHWLLLGLTCICPLDIQRKFSTSMRSLTL